MDFAEAPSLCYSLKLAQRAFISPILRAGESTTSSAYKNMGTTLLRTAMAVIAGYNEWNTDAILAPRASNCTQRTFPARLGVTPLNNTAYAGFITTIMPYFANFTVTVLDTYVDEANNRVAMQALGSADSVIGPYRNEYVVMMKMTEDQTKVWEVREFIDSEVRAAFFPELTAYISMGGPTLEELASASDR